MTTRRHTSPLLLLALTFVLVVSSLLPVRASTISGTITDKESGEPLPFASVLIRGSTVTGVDIQRGVMGDETGRYVLTSIPAGAYRIRFVYVGYTEFSDSMKVADDVTVNLNVQLLSQPFETDEIVVEADRFADERDLQTGFIDVDMRTLTAVPSVGEADPIRSLQFLPGVQAASDVSSGLYIRGGGPDQNLILLDNVPVYNPTHAFGFFSTFNADVLDNVTLYKGAYPAEHGGRLGSVLDVRSLEPIAKNIHGNGGLSTIASRLALRGPAGRHRWMLAGRRTHLDPLLGVLRKNDNQIPYYYFYDVNGRFTTRQDGIRFDTNGYFGRDDIRLELNEGSQIDINWGNTVLSATAGKLFGESVLAKLMLSGTEYKSDANIGFLNTPFTVENRIRDVSLRSDLDWKLSRNRVSLGAQATQFDVLYRQTFNQTTGIDYRAKPYELSVYIDDRWIPQAGTTLRLGLRGRYLSDGQRTLLEPRLAVSHLINEVRIKFGGGFYHQYLQLVTTEGFSAADFYVPIDESTDPGRSWQTVLGLEWEATPRYQFSLEGYYTDLQNLVVLNNNVPADQESFTASDLFYTGGEGFATGLEFFAQRRTSNLTGWIGYTLGWTRRQFDELNLGDQFPPKYDRRHDINAVANYRRGKWSYGASAIFASGQAFTPASARYQLRAPGTGVPETKTLAASRNSARLLPYHRVDAKIARDFSLFGSGWQWYVQVFNLYSRRNEWFIQYKESDATAEVVKQLPMIPSLGVNLEF